MKITNLLLLLAYVLASSILGLGGVFALIGLGGVVPRLFMAVWSQPVADVIFIVGSVAVGVGTYRLCTRSPWLAALAAAAGSGVVYGVSCTALFPYLAADPTQSDATIGFQFGLTYGLVGLVFASLAPILLWRARSRSAARLGDTPMNPETDPAPALDAPTDDGQVRPLVLDRDPAVGKHVAKLHGDDLGDVPARE